MQSPPPRPPAPAEPEAPLPSRVGDYRVIERIGLGSLGPVLRARHFEDSAAQVAGGDVAIQLLWPSLAQNDRFVEDLLVAVRRAQPIAHPALAPLHELIVAGPLVALVMPLLVGPRLSARIGPALLPLSAAAALLRPLAEALDLLHLNGVVHGEVGPDRAAILPSGAAVWMDMGLARRLARAALGGPGAQASVSASASVWASPQRAAGEGPSPADDRYAFALIAAALLGGGPPWAPELGPEAVAEAKATDQLRQISVDAPSRAAAAAAALQAALRADPAARPGSCVELMDALEGVVDEAAPQPAPPGGERWALGGLSFALAPVPLGPMDFGSPPGDPDAADDERPHRAELRRPAAIGLTPVTQALWRAVMGHNPAYFQPEVGAEQRPVERVSWEQAVEFCDRLSAALGLPPAHSGAGASLRCALDGPGFRLPTEHEWEAAARAGAPHRYAGADTADPVAWTAENSEIETHPVGEKQPNALGLVDMSGGVWEWCWDVYAPYPAASPTDPAGPNTGPTRVFRGGSWSSPATSARVANRSAGPPTQGFDNVGLRLARTLSPKPSGEPPK
jgi:formylglycine-generating enzyme required for sulfatase activity